MAKKISAFLFAFLLLFCFSACGAGPENDSAPGESGTETEATEKDAEPASLAGFYVDQEVYDAEGILYCIALREDGEGVVAIQDPYAMQWADGLITPPENFGEPFSFLVEGDTLRVPAYGWEFTRMDALLAEEPEWQAYMQDGTLPGFVWTPETEYAVSLTM